MSPGLSRLLRRGASALVLAAIAAAAMAQPRSLQDPGSGPPPPSDGLTVKAQGEKAPPVDPAKVQGLPSARDYRAPAGIAFKASDFTSEGVRLTAQWFYAVENEGKRLPTVIMAQGRGATAATFRQDAIDLAKAGYLVMLFDYRGWGESDGRVALTGARPAAGGKFTAEVQELRGYFDPWEQTEDWFNAISYAVTEPMVDPARIGLRGSSESGGYVVYVAGHDARVKALASQVTSADLRPYKPYQQDPAGMLAEANAAASGLATGKAQYPTERGAPVGNKMLRWAPVERAHGIKTPSLFVLAEKEELFSNVNNGIEVCERVAGPRKMVIIAKITHYDIYGGQRQQALDAAIDYFDKYLKPAGAKTRVRVNTKEPERGGCTPNPVPPKGEEDKDGTGEQLKILDGSGRWN